jgi:coproporphyrinogen III oxidase-like Fe-S oxidoreductase
MVSDSTKRDIEKTLGPVDYRREEALYRLISERFASDYISSSAWCFSLKDAMVDEYIVNYDEYAGLGSGSIGYMNGMCYANTFDILDYINRLEKDMFPVDASRKFKKKDQIRYDFIMKLFGMKLDMEALERKYGGGVLKYLWPYMLPLVLADALRYRRGTAYLTDRGRYWWVVVMREFFTAVNNFRYY